MNEEKPAVHIEPAEDAPTIEMIEPVLEAPKPPVKAGVVTRSRRRQSQDQMKPPSQDDSKHS